MLHSYNNGEWIEGTLIRTRFGHGFHTFEVNNYQTFVHEIAPSFIETSDQWVWRGMEHPSWLLQPSLTRELGAIRKSGNEWKIEATRLTLEHTLEYLKVLRGLGHVEPHHDPMYRELLDIQHLSGIQSFGTVLNRLPIADRMALIELLATGQHHGLATPLLDWSNVPLIALFFAFELAEKLAEDSGSRVVYALNKTLLLKYFPQIDPNEITLVDSMGFRNPRIIGQAGLFTFITSHIPLDKVLVKELPRSESAPILLRFLIRNTQRKDCLKYLGEIANIHSRTVYPDLHGAAKKCNGLLSERIRESGK
jgi:FRG domain